MVTYIPMSNYTNYKTIVSDHATPSSGTYAWYFTNEKPKMNWVMSSLIKIANFFGITLSKKGYKLDAVWNLETILSNFTDYENMLKAVHSWEKNSTMLYLNVQNEWGSNLALTGSYAAPTTLTQMKGHLSDLNIDVGSNSVGIRLKFYQYTTGV